MDVDRATNQIVFTNKARCRDCYRCLRVCPVKAIHIQQGQARVIADRCLACGTCIRECPQHAKSFRNDLERAIRLVGERTTSVACSVAPSFAALYNQWERARLPSALRKLGFAHVAETAIGAYPVAQATAQAMRDDPAQSRICTACPAVVSFVEQYRPQFTAALVPVASPMVAHARMIRGQLGAQTKVVFIGPCVAKKAEAERPEHAGLIDVVLTFTELQQWFEREGIRLDRLEESGFDDQPAGAARLFPLPGGLARTAALSTDTLDTEVVAVSGFDDLQRLLAALPGTDRPRLIEPLFCTQGCINGPAMPAQRNPFAGRHELLAFTRAQRPVAAGRRDQQADVGTRHTPRPVVESTPVTEEAIAQVLAATGKADPADQLNCSACGYPSCRDKAIAVIRGLAEVEMCVPWMRRLAERRTDRIIETSPNGILILDDKMRILSMNAAFSRMFYCSEAVLGKHVSYLMDPEPFERVATGRENMSETTVKHQRYNLVAHQIVYPLRDEHQYVGIFVNITSSQASEQRLEELRARTVAQARELLEHQIAMAQEMAKFLGESSARGEELVENLLELASDPTAPPAEGNSSADLMALIKKKMG